MADGEAPTSAAAPQATAPVRVRAHHDDGLAIYHRAGTEPDAPTVIYVHGAMDRAASFIRAVRRRPDLDVVRYDRRGYGRSTGIGHCATMDEHVDDLLRVADGRPAIVIGHSLGGVIALAAGLRAPAQISAIGAFEAPLWPRDTEAPERADRGADREALADPASAGERFMRRMIGDDAWLALPESTRATRRAEGPALVADLATVGTSGGLIRRTPVTVPLVVGYGTRSSERHQASARALAAATPGSELVAIAGAGHDAHRTHPEEFADFVDLAVRAASTGRAQADGARRSE